MYAQGTIFLSMGALLASVSCGQGETITKRGTNVSGQTCEVKVERHADGSITAAGSGGGGSAGSASTGSSPSSSSAGGASVHVQAGGGNVSSSSSVSGGKGTSSSTITVNGCTVSTSSP